MKAVILAGGLGTRLRPFTDLIPKPLLPVGEKAIIEIQIERLSKFGFTDIYLATNYKSEYIEKYLGDGSAYGINLHYSKEDKPLGTAGPLKLLESQLDEPFLVMNGDILTDIDYGRLIEFSTGKDENILTLVIRKEVTPFEFGNIEFDGDFVTTIREKPDIVLYILAGIYFLNPKILQRIPADSYFGMDALISDCLKDDLPVLKYEMEEYWLDIGRVKDYEKAQNHFKEGS